MRNLIFIFSFFMLTGNAISAQENILFGAKGGINFTDLSSDNYRDTEFRTGFHLGLFAEIPVGRKFSLQPEVLYATQGAETEVIMLGSGPIPWEYNLDYIQVPVLAKIYLFRNFSLEVGPSFNFLVKEQGEIVDPTGTIFGHNSEEDFGSTFEFSGALGVSYKFLSKIFASPRYTQGFTNSFEDGDVKNNGFQLGVGYIF